MLQHEIKEGHEHEEGGVWPRLLALVHGNPVKKANIQSALEHAQRQVEQSLEEGWRLVYVDRPSKQALRQVEQASEEGWRLVYVDGSSKQLWKSS